MSVSDHNGSGYASEYLPGHSGLAATSSEFDKLKELELTPNSKRWFINSEALTRELGLDSDLPFEDFSTLPVH